MTREVSYETILKANRKIMHQIAGDVIESEYKDRLELFLYDLAIHYDLAEHNEKAKKYLCESDLAGFGKTLDENWQLKKSLSNKIY